MAATIVAPIQRSAVSGTSTLSLAAHASTRVGDTQLMFYSSHQSLMAGTATPAGWTVVGKYTSAHSGVAIYTRNLTSATIPTTITKSNSDFGRIEVRTYRSAGTLTVLGNGTGLVAPVRPAINGLLVRIAASSQANTTSNGTKTLTPDAALVNSTGAMTYSWYEGLAIGDDPTVNGSDAPARTSTISAQTVFPQWVDLQIADGTPSYPGTESTSAMGDASTMEVNTGIDVPLDPRGNASMEVNTGVNLTLSPGSAASMEENVGIERPVIVVQDVPQLGWGSPLLGPDTVELVVSMAKAVAYFEVDVI